MHTQQHIHTDTIHTCINIHINTNTLTQTHLHRYTHAHRHKHTHTHTHRGTVTRHHSKKVAVYQPGKRPHEKTNFCCLNHSVCSILLWQPELLKISTPSQDCKPSFCPRRLIVPISQGNKPSCSLHPLLPLLPLSFLASLMHTRPLKGTGWIC